MWLKASFVYPHSPQLSAVFSSLFILVFFSSCRASTWKTVNRCWQFSFASRTHEVPQPKYSQGSGRFFFDDFFFKCLYEIFFYRYRWVIRAMGKTIWMLFKWKGLIITLTRRGFCLCIVFSFRGPSSAQFGDCWNGLKTDIVEGNDFGLMLWFLERLRHFVIFCIF